MFNKKNGMVVVGGVAFGGVSDCQMEGVGL
jgi:hypothetical protein